MEWLNVAGQGTAVIAFIGCFVLGCIQSRIWNGIEAPGFVKIVAHRLLVDANPTGDSLTEPPSEQYFTFGRMFLLVYIFELVSLYCIPFGTTSGIRIAIHSLLILAGFGNFLAYYLSKQYGVAIRKLGYRMIEMPSLLIVSILCTVDGIIMAHSGFNLYIILSIATPLLCLVFTALMRYMPHGPMLGILIVLVMHSFLS